MKPKFGLPTMLGVLGVLLLAGFLFEERSWHQHQEALRLAQEQANRDLARVQRFLDDVEAFKAATHLHAAAIYNCQNGFRESDKYIWVRWQKVDAEIRSMSNRSDLADYLKDSTQEQNAFEMVKMGNELLFEAQQASGLISPPEWMTERAEWKVTPEELAKF